MHRYSEFIIIFSIWWLFYIVFNNYAIAMLNQGVVIIVTRIFTIQSFPIGMAFTFVIDTKTSIIAIIVALINVITHFFERRALEFYTLIVNFEFNLIFVLTLEPIVEWFSLSRLKNGIRYQIMVRITLNSKTHSYFFGSDFAFPNSINT